MMTPALFSVSHAGLWGQHRLDPVQFIPLPEMVRAAPPGQRFIDLGALFASLKKGGFAGYVAYEMRSSLRGEGREANLDRAAAPSLRRIRELIA